MLHFAAPILFSFPLRSGVAINLAGGTHHAHAGHGAGFCVFNDAAIADRLMQAEQRLQSVTIVDRDVHQGEGSASILARDDSVFTLSIHEICAALAG